MVPKWKVDHFKQEAKIFEESSSYSEVTSYRVNESHLQENAPQHLIYAGEFGDLGRLVVSFCQNSDVDHSDDAKEWKNTISMTKKYVQMIIVDVRGV